MAYRLHILEVKPCGCDAEGQVRAKLDGGAEIWFYYQATDQQAAQLFQEGTTAEVELIGRLCSASASPQAAKALSFPFGSCHFQATGHITAIEEHEGESIFALASTFSFKFDNELGKEPIATGSWVNVQGELWAEI